MKGNYSHIDFERALHFRYGETCQNCRYYRRHTTGAAAGLCLLLGRDLSLFSVVEEIPEERRTCDAWSKRPADMIIDSEGSANNPFWKDPYLSRSSQMRLRRKWRAAIKAKEGKEAFYGAREE